MPHPVSLGEFDPSAPVSTQAGPPISGALPEAVPPVQVSPVPADAASESPVQQAPESDLPE